MTVHEVLVALQDADDGAEVVGLVSVPPSGATPEVFQRVLGVEIPAHNERVILRLG